MSEPNALGDRVCRQVVLRQRPSGLLREDDVELVEVAVPECPAKHILVKMIYLQMDAAVRSWLDEGEGYLPAVQIGEPVRAGGLGRVVESDHPDYEVGDWCSAGLPGWTEYVVADPEHPFVTPGPEDDDPLFQIGVLSSPGPTAYCGLDETGGVRAGDTVLVSAAAGSTGSMVVQVAHNLGASVIGIAGTDEKCRYVESIGAEACINRRTEDVAARLKELRPKGVDIYFDNVGGPLLDVVLRRIAVGARVIVCGAISMYNETGRPPGPSNYLNLINKRASMVGIEGTTFVPRYPAVHRLLRQWRDEGKLDFRIHLTHGLETCVASLNSLFDGSNTGKPVVQVCDDPGPGPYTW